eukprot:4368915-Amphidinium_carterae.1
MEILKLYKTTETEELHNKSGALVSQAGQALSLHTNSVCFRPHLSAFTRCSCTKWLGYLSSPPYERFFGVDALFGP